MKFFDEKLYKKPAYGSYTLENLMQRGVFDERDIDYLNHLEVEEVSIATEGVIRATGHDIATTYTDTYREIKGWFLGVESKRKYIIEICEDLIDWLRDKDMDYRNMDLDMGTFKTFLKTSETFFWRYYFLLHDGTYNKIISDLKAANVSDLELLYDINFSKRQELTKHLDSIRSIKELIRVVELYKTRTNTFFNLILKREIKIKSFPFQVILLGAADLRRTAKKIVNLAI